MILLLRCIKIFSYIVLTSKFIIYKNLVSTLGSKCKYLRFMTSAASNRWKKFDLEVRPLEAFNIRKVMGASHLSSLQPRSLSMANCGFYLKTGAIIFLFVKGFLLKIIALTFIGFFNWYENTHLKEWTNHCILKAQTQSDLNYLDNKAYI